jgi:hypothetical protein
LPPARRRAAPLPLGFARRLVTLASVGAAPAPSALASWPLRERDEAGSRLLREGPAAFHAAHQGGRLDRALVPAGSSEARRSAGLTLAAFDSEARVAMDAKISMALLEAYAPSTNSKDAGHFAAWTRACRRLGTSEWRTDVASNLGLNVEGHQEEVYLMCAALLTMYAEMRPRRRSDPAADPRSALKKLQAVRRIHRRRLITMVPLSHVTPVLRGMLRAFIREHGVASLIPERKLPLTNSIIAGMLATPEGSQRGTQPPVSRASYYWTAMFACFECAAETGGRAFEFIGPKGSNGFTFDSLTFKIGGVLLKEPTDEQCASMGAGDGILYAHRVAKNDVFGAWFAATPSWLPWRPVGAGRSACRALVRLWRACTLRGEQRAKAPLFGPEPGAFFTAHQVREAFDLCLAEGARVPEAERGNYSFHSFRIFLACALLSSGCPRWMIKRLCRWRGDASLEIYARLSDAEWAEWGGRVLGAHVDASIVPRLPQLDFSPAQQQAFTDMATAMLSADLGRPGSADADLEAGTR